MAGRPHTRSSLAKDLTALGVAGDDIVMIHAAFGRVGTVLGGPDALVDALLDTADTVLSYQDWEIGLDVWSADGSVPDDLREHVPPYDPPTSRPARDHGVIASVVRTRPGAKCSANPGAAMAAIGGRADEFTRDHPMDDGYGVGSPLARLVDAGGTVLMVGAPLDTMTLLHHAEAIADIPGKRRVSREYPLRTDAGTVWRWIDEFDTAEPIVAGLPDDYFASVVTEFLATGKGSRGLVGDAERVLVDARAMVDFAVGWLEGRC